MNLSKTQQDAIKKLTSEWQSAYDMGVGLGTLRYLWRKGIAELITGIGAIHSPRTAIKWRLKLENRRREPKPIADQYEEVRIRMEAGGCL